MKLRWKILIAAGVVLVLVAASLTVTMHVQPANELEAYKKLLKDKGEKLEIKEVLPPVVSQESNGVMVLTTVFSMLSSGGENDSNQPPVMKMVAPGRAMVGWTQPYLFEPGPGGYSNSWENAEMAAEASQPIIELLNRAFIYPVADFQLDYTKGAALLLPHLGPLKGCMRTLTAAAMCDMHRGDAASAATNICSLLALTQSQHHERVVISQLVRIALANIAAAATWELLQATNLNDTDLANLQTAWNRQEFIEGIEGSLLMERAINEDLIRKMRADLGGFGGGGSSDWFQDLKEAGSAFMWQSSWSYSDELQMLQAHQITLEAIRTAKTNQFFNPAYSNMIVQLHALGITNVPDSWVTTLDLPDYRRIFSEGARALDRTVYRAMSAEACKRIAITAIALKRYQLKHGQWPEKLADLPPEFLPSVPLDPVDGKPLRYRRNDDGTYLLYSIGDDGVDGGGDVTTARSGSSMAPGWYWLRGRDWVWPQPASPAEVQYFFEHPPK